MSKSLFRYVDLDLYETQRTVSEQWAPSSVKLVIKFMGVRNIDLNVFVGQPPP